jgi:hypothetical protein
MQGLASQCRQPDKYLPFISADSLTGHNKMRKTLEENYIACE